MTNSRMSRGAQFCENVVQAVFAESQKFGVSPKEVMMKCIESFNNKATAIEKANVQNRNDMLDAMCYSFQANPDMFGYVKRYIQNDIMSCLSVGIVPQKRLKQLFYEKNYYRDCIGLLHILLVFAN